MSPIVDFTERHAAIDPARSCIVQAPAGSGKTELLIQRFLALLARVERPEEILAITFTRKAAAEMRSRLLAALNGATGPAPTSEHGLRTWELARAALAQDRRHGWNLDDNPGRLAIQTIDGFNAALVRRMPWLSRLGGMPAIAEAPVALYRKAAERALERLRRSDGGAEGIGCLLAHLDNRLDHLRDLLVAMLGRRDQWLRHLGGRHGEENRRRLEQSLRSLVETELALVHALFPPAIGLEVVELAAFAGDNLQEAEKQNGIALLAGITGFPAATAAELPLWRALAELLLTADGNVRKKIDKNGGFPADKKEPCVSMKERMRQLLSWCEEQEILATGLQRVRSLPAVVYEEEQWRVLQALLQLLPLAVAELWLVFREEGEVDFAEIALKARQSLLEEGNPSDLLLRLDSRLNHILVDEFQDTAYLQYELLHLLTSGWTADDGRSLFLVGDPMQSIYRFREAEVGLFLQARSRGLAEVQLESIRLRTNFRSQAGIVEWVNATFAQLFPVAEDASRGAVPLAEAEAFHPSLAGTAVQFHPWAERSDAGEAQRVAELAQQSLAAGESVAVLVRSRSHLQRILPALRAAGLPYQAHDIDPLASRPIAGDLVALTRALLHADDRLSWLTILRAPWCGLTLADLHALCGGRRAAIRSLLADPAIMAGLSIDGRQRAERTFAHLRAAGRQRGRITLRQLVEGCWLALGGPVLVDAAALADAGRIFDLLEELDHGGDLRDFDALAAGLGRLFASPDTLADGRLQIMTIHKAKGLEFDTVILPGLGRSTAAGDPPLLRWLELPQHGLLLAPIHPRDGGERDPIYDLLGNFEKEKGELETVRLLYVAATRAKKRLHLLGHAGRDKSGACKPAAGSLLQKLWPVAEDAFAALPAGASEEEKAETAAPLLRRLPLDWQPPQLAAAPLPHLPETLSPSGLGKADLREIVFSGWEAEAARHIGTVTHTFFERLGRDGIDAWPPTRLPELEAPAKQLLSRAGVSAAEIAGAVQKILRALGNTVAGERGRWLLTAHPQAACECALSGVSAGQVVHAIIDRTFVADDVRWVVDYKTSEPRHGEALPAFLSGEGERYRVQLATYAELFRSLEPHRPVRAALYFPLIDAWHEIPLALPVISSTNETFLSGGAA